jgi:ribosomal protein S18 acetylase RimI-like enzyme
VITTLSMMPVKSIRGLSVVPADHFAIEQLADIYNQTRIDYLVPMPMNARRMQEYIDWYDVDLDASIVIQIGDGLFAGLCMLGLRGNQAWITRLGIMPPSRQRGIGHYIMEEQIKIAKQRAVQSIQLEVIKGNDPAYHLFQKLGFRELRELMVIRRPPGDPDVGSFPLNFPIQDMASDEITSALRTQLLATPASWLDEPLSLLNMGSLKGYGIADRGELIFRVTPFQITHMTFTGEARHNSEIALALLAHLHHNYPKVDTKIENVPSDTAIWRAYQQMNYLEVFRRIEMRLSLV